VSFRLIVDFFAAGAAVIVMRRMAEELHRLPKRSIARCASCGRQLPSRCRCRDTG
jgi:hypothetical protein